MAALNWLVHRSHIPVKVRTAQTALRTFQVVPHGMPRQHTHTHAGYHRVTCLLPQSPSAMDVDCASFGVSTKTTEARRQQVFASCELAATARSQIWWHHIQRHHLQRPSGAGSGVTTSRAKTEHRHGVLDPSRRPSELGEWRALCHAMRGLP